MTDKVRDALAAIHACAERAIGLDPSSMDNYFVQIGDIARAALYAQPAPGALADQMRAPLTDKQIDEITDAQWGNGCALNQYMAHRAYARAVERAVREQP